MMNGNRRAHGQPKFDFRNVERGREWLKRMIEAAEGKKDFSKVVEEMEKQKNLPFLVGEKD